MEVIRSQLERAGNGTTRHGAMLKRILDRRQRLLTECEVNDLI